MTALGAFKAKCFNCTWKNLGKVYGILLYPSDLFLLQLKWEAELCLSRAIEAFSGLIVLPSAVVDKYGQSSSDFIADNSSDNRGTARNAYIFRFRSMRARALEGCNSTSIPIDFKLEII